MSNDLANALGQWLHEEFGVTPDAHHTVTVYHQSGSSYAGTEWTFRQPVTLDQVSVRLADDHAIRVQLLPRDEQYRGCWPIIRPGPDLADPDCFDTLRRLITRPIATAELDELLLVMASYYESMSTQDGSRHYHQVNVSK